MTTVIGWLIASGYIALALVFARSTLRRWQADPKSDTARSNNDGVDRMMIALGALLWGLLWPLSSAILGLRSWLWKPADADKAHREQMQEDCQHWRREQSNAATEQERTTAKTIADTLDDLLRRGGRP